MHIEKKLDSNCTRMLQAILNKSWKQHTTKQQLYGHLPSISKIIHIRWTRQVGHCWRRKDKVISDDLQQTPSHRWAGVGWPAWTYLQLLFMDTGCNLGDMPEVMDDRDEWWERIREVHPSGTTWWWWWYIYIYIYI